MPSRSSLDMFAPQLALQSICETTRRCLAPSCHFVSKSKSSDGSFDQACVWAIWCSRRHAI